MTKIPEENFLQKQHFAATDTELKLGSLQKLQNSSEKHKRNT
jgi:hypothetical protein